MKTSTSLALSSPQRIYAVVLVVIVAALLAGKSDAASPPDPAARGLEIAAEADDRESGFGDLTANMTMILRNRQGEESTRQLRIRTLETENDGDKSLVLFDEPLDVRGTAFLNHTHKTAADDQWLYLPALKRVKRIASNNKSGPFMGSEFAYEDLSSQEIEKYTYEFVGDEKISGVLHYVVERRPVDRSSGYTRQVVWYDAAEFRPQRIDYYDRKNELLKTLSFHDYKQYKAEFWRADEMRMENHQTGKSTVLVWTDYQFGNGFTDREFEEAALRRAR